MYAGADRPDAGRRHRRRALAVSFAVTLALVTAGCSDTSNGAGSGSGNTAAPLVTGEQVVTACFQDYFYNGILPKAAAQSNCRSCVVDRLRKLGVRPVDGETVMDMLTGDRLSNTNIQLLQNRCDESDANAQ